ncbi:hypothetical protein SAMN05660776_0592 [Salegentibacter holothuriorum]|uniref:DUF2194 domain-containing protein n=1 Tax=Salegentibacter holothuriorum TaxID=241145 RepID=A0A1T5AJE2_9FLAO|nr:DUF2194 domain-containing protein [Salegentibacter holothuriorum]SKB34723.1 hypothetical protein SAMN05660776_0592 [Salegentibacter holothuriorum]
MKIKLPINLLKYTAFCLLLCFTGCKDDVEDPNVAESQPKVVYDKMSNKPMVAYIMQPGNDLSAKNSKHIRKTLNYAKIPFGEIKSDEFNENPDVPGSVKVIVVYNLAPLNRKAMDFLINFVAKGGHIFIPSVGIDKNFGFLAGVKDDADLQINTTAQGFLFKTDFIPGFKGKDYKSLTTHYGLKQHNFREDVEILATSISEEDYPLIIKNKIRKGSVITFNTEQFSQKQERGLFFAAILEGLEGVPYPIANASSIMLDDFPAPLYNAKMEPIQSEMDISQADFYSQVWWKDMLKLAKEEDIAYSAYVCFDYSNHTSPPFNFREWERSILNGANGADKLMISIKNSNHEIELHGYNHVSLTQADWPNKSYMGLSLQAVKKRWAARGYGRLPVSYVPPSNIIDSTGFVALEENIPSIVYNASIYLGDFEEGGDREFDPEPYNYHFFNFPRISSGYAMTSTREFNQQSLYLYTGIWTHFIHPDDIYQIPGEEPLESAGDYALRNINSYGWRVSEDGSPGLFPRFWDYIKNVKETFPLIRFLKVSEAAKITQNWRETSYEFSETEKTVQVAAQTENSVENENFWFAYVSEKNSMKMEAYLKSNKLKYTKTSLFEGFLYNIQTLEKQLSLPKFENVSSRNLLGSLPQDYSAYLLVKPSENFEDNDAEKNINELKSEIVKSDDYNKENWLSLFKYLGWENRQDEIWPLLEQKYSKNNSSVYVKLSSEFTTQSDYPNLETRKRWMLRQIDLNPENIKLRRDFIGYFGSNTEVQLTRDELLGLIENTSSGADRFSYLSLLNEKYPEAALHLVKNVEPCREDFKFAAYTVSWILADAKDYKQAILWSNCSEEISEKVVDDWRLQSGNYEIFKEKNFPLYIEYLIADNDKKAARELLEIKACSKDLKPLAATIAYTYANQGSFRKALEWSACEPNFPLVERMQWFYALKNYEEVERLYANYSKKNNPGENEIIQVFMTEYYMGRSNIKTAWEIASKLSLSRNKDRLRRQLNKDVLYLSSQEKRLLLSDYSSLFYPEVAAQIKHNLRITEGDFVRVESNIISDRLDPTSFGTEAVYGIRDKKLHQHQFGLSYYSAYAIPLQESFVNNIDEQLPGFIYRFKSRERLQKFNYGFGTRLEFNNAGKAYFHLQASASISIDSLYSSAQLSRKPAVTGPAYALDIYQTQLNIYEELQFKKKFRAILYLEGNHYSDDVQDIQALTSISMDIDLNDKSKFKPYTEVSGMLGNSNRTGGYPYWTLDERLYGGMGLAYEYLDKNNFWKLNLDAGYFLDTFSDEFQRYRGNMIWPISKYLHFNAQAEFYTLKDFYSNNFTFGLKYFLKDN